MPLAKHFQVREEHSPDMQGPAGGRLGALLCSLAPQVLIAFYI